MLTSHTLSGCTKILTKIVSTLQEDITVFKVCIFTVILLNGAKVKKKKQNAYLDDIHCELGLLGMKYI